MKKKICIVLLVCLACMALTACGKTKNTSDIYLSTEHTETDDIKHPKTETDAQTVDENKTTNVLISKLQDRLIQCCIDFINENNLGDLERVDFNVDGLQISSEFGEWSPATDSFISGFKFVEENGYPVMKCFVKYC